MKPNLYVQDYKGQCCMLLFVAIFLSCLTESQQGRLLIPVYSMYSDFLLKPKLRLPIMIISRLPINVSRAGLNEFQSNTLWYPIQNQTRRHKLEFYFLRHIVEKVKRSVACLYTDTVIQYQTTFQGEKLTQVNKLWYRTLFLVLTVINVRNN